MLVLLPYRRHISVGAPVKKLFLAPFIVVATLFCATTQPATLSEEKKEEQYNKLMAIAERGPAKQLKEQVNAMAWLKPRAQHMTIALRIATECQNKEAIVALLDLGANPNGEQPYGLPWAITASMVCVFGVANAIDAGEKLQTPKRNVVESVEANASMETEEVSGEEALARAKEIFELLVAHSTTDPLCTDNEGLTLYHMALITRAAVAGLELQNHAETVAAITYVIETLERDFTKRKICPESLLKNPPAQFTQTLAAFEAFKKQQLLARCQV